VTSTPYSSLTSVFAGRKDKGTLVPANTSATERLLGEELDRIEEFSMMLSSHSIECVCALGLSDEGKVRVILAIINRLRNRVLTGQALRDR